VKSFLTALSLGVHDTELLSEHKRIIQELTKQKACIFSKGIYTLAPHFRLGSIDVSSTGTGFLQVYDAKNSYKDLLIEPRDLKGASRGDIVLAKRLKGRSGRPKAVVVLILKRSHATSIVYIRKLHAQTVGVSLKTGLQATLSASQKSLRSLPQNTILKIDNETNGILEVLGTLDDPKVDEAIALAHFNKHEAFSKEAEQEAKAHGDVVDKSMYPDRLDLTHLPFCTIDPPDAKDFDDAIYFDVQKHTLYVAIADVSEYVFAFGPTDKEAKERGFSIYFPHKSIPMLPRTLSENLCSLKPNEDRLAFCFALTLDPQTLQVTKSELHNGIIHSNRRYTYDEIDLFLANDFSQKNEVDDKILEWLMPLHSMMNKVRKQRLYEGFEFRSTEIRMEIDEAGSLLATHQEHETPSHALIEDCMLLANKAAAKRIDRGVFRNHEAPSFEKIEALLVDLELIGLHVSFSPDINKLITSIQTQASAMGIREDVDKLIIKSQKKAVYEAESKGHFGLGFDTYTHFTSPIRRYSDLLLHRLLKAQIINDEKQNRFLLNDIDATCARLSELERESDKVAWEFMDRKFARWAAQHNGERFRAIITDVGGKNIIARLDDTIQGARLFVMNEDVELLERVEVVIVESDIASARITAKITKRLDP
jgi:ribonuclease R